ncbi:MAG: HDIG domain-containing protein [Clostridiales bacterium]|nr:HDIG domain-containing protein [Clostridiales bacterium]
MLPVALKPEIRDGVVRTLPQVLEIEQEALRNKVIDAWALALQLNGYERIEEMPGSGMPEASVLGDQSMHIRVVGYSAVSLYENLCKAYRMEMGLDRDLLIACALLHDVGKPYEFNPQNRERWAANHKTTGAPNVRHPAYGAYIAITCGLPEEVVHVCASHSPEGRFVTRSAYATLVHYADDGSWFSLASLFDLNIPKL